MGLCVLFALLKFFIQTKIAKWSLKYTIYMSWGLTSMFVFENSKSITNIDEMVKDLGHR